MNTTWLSYIITQLPVRTTIIWTQHNFVWNKRSFLLRRANLQLSETNFWEARKRTKKFVSTTFFSLFVFFRRWWKAAAASLKVTKLYKIFFVTCGCSTACNQDIVGLAVVVAQEVVHQTMDWEVRGSIPAAAGSWFFSHSSLSYLSIRGASLIRSLAE